jgi:hypothetical protein
VYYIRGLLTALFFDALFLKFKAVLRGADLFHFGKHADKGFQILITQLEGYFRDGVV